MPTCSGRNPQFDDDLIFFSTRSPSHRESAALATHLSVATALPLKNEWQNGDHTTIVMTIST